MESWSVGFLDVWILGSGFFAFPVLLFDRNAASENEPKSEQQKNRFCTGVYNVLKGSACRRVGGNPYLYLCFYVYVKSLSMKFRYALPCRKDCSDRQALGDDGSIRRPIIQRLLRVDSKELGILNGHPANVWA